ncbi:MAG: triose-phosphate isomerase [Bacteroidales bacterium]|nr:triose-phosphate isomerase [Bacteroidales bacterium]
MRKKIAAANWKMNQDKSSVKSFFSFFENYTFNQQIELIIFPPFLYMPLAHELNKNNLFKLGAQNVHYEEKGAYTGEIALYMLKEFDVQFVLIGHSERRKYFLETSEILVKKLKHVLKYDLTPVFCCGEELTHRYQNRHMDIVYGQLMQTIFQFSAEEIKKMIIAYEPVWAIGTGVNATPEQAQEMHHFIRQSINEHFNSNIADDIPILYGGSITAENAHEIFSMPDVDGGLIGGASLKPDSYEAIVKALNP